MSHIATARQSEDLTSSATVQAVLTAIGRILISLIFLLSGFSKLTAPAMTIGFEVAVRQILRPFRRKANVGPRRHQ